MTGTVIVAFSLGKPSRAKGNILTAWWAKELSRRNGNAPIVADRSVPIKNVCKLHWVGGEAQTHNSTIELAKELVELAIKKKWDDVVVAECPDYTDRVVRDIKVLFERSNLDYQVKVRGADTSSENPEAWFDRASTQFWTWYGIVFRAHEKILMTMPFSWYEWITTR
jgi:hypothetical protein